MRDGASVWIQKVGGSKEKKIPGVTALVRLGKNSLVFLLPFKPTWRFCHIINSSGVENACFTGRAKYPDLSEAVQIIACDFHTVSHKGLLYHLFKIANVPRNVMNKKLRWTYRLSKSSTAQQVLISRLCLSPS